MTNQAQINIGDTLLVSDDGKPVTLTVEHISADGNDLFCTADDGGGRVLVFTEVWLSEKHCLPIVNPKS